MCRAVFSAALCRGLIEAEQGYLVSEPGHLRFPRLYAAASLKRVPVLMAALAWLAFSAALCRGLIEAGSGAGAPSPNKSRFPRLYAAASLKRAAGHLSPLPAAVFRGFMPRPH